VGVGVYHSVEVAAFDVGALQSKPTTIGHDQWAVDAPEKSAQHMPIRQTNSPNRIETQSLANSGCIIGQSSLRIANQLHATNMVD
jgi:hypothetical protein